MRHKIEQSKLFQIADSSPEILPVIVLVLMGCDWAFPTPGQVLGAKPPYRKLSSMPDVMPFIFLSE
jgi:hypothetical protein